jgi:hypothetical protein
LFFIAAPNIEEIGFIDFKNHKLSKKIYLVAYYVKKADDRGRLVAAQPEEK